MNTPTTSNESTKDAHTNILELKTVQLLVNSYPGQIVSKTAVSAYKTLGSFPIINSFLLFIQSVIMTIVRAINSLPWPNWFMQLLYRIEAFIYQIFFIFNQALHWWLNLAESLWTKFKEFIHHIFNLIGSLVSKWMGLIKNFWQWAFNLACQMVKLALFPIFWAIGFIGDLLHPQKEKTLGSSSHVEGPYDDLNILLNNGKTPQIRIRKVNNADEDCRSTASSEYESDVSVVSETWNIGPSDTPGKSYNRKEIKATAEGRLREAMYKRVNKQLTRMRRSSVKISEDMASYVREFVNPRQQSSDNASYPMLHTCAKRLRIREGYTYLENELSRRPFLKKMIALYISFLIAPLAILGVIFDQKRSSRSRTGRSEGFKRRSVVPGTSATGTSALRQSAEPVAEIDVIHPFDNTEDNSKKNNNSEDDFPCARDSALASSIDELPSSEGESEKPLKEQIIHEETEADSYLIEDRQAPKDDTVCDYPKPKSATDTNKLQKDTDKRTSEVEKDQHSKLNSVPKTPKQAPIANKEPANHTPHQNNKKRTHEKENKCKENEIQEAKTRSPNVGRRKNVLPDKDVSEIHFRELENLLKSPKKTFSLESILSNEESKRRRRAKGHKRIFFSL